MIIRKYLALPILVAIALAPSADAVAASAWVAQGPGPIFNGQVSGLAGNPVAGAVNAIVVDSANADALLVATVNGGIWATTNATNANPSWTPLTDRLPALSISSLARSPADSRLIFAGTGSTSSYALNGSPGFGVLRSTDGGATWQILAGSTFAGQIVDVIVPTAQNAGRIVLAATRRFPTAQEVDNSGAASASGATPQAAPVRGVFRSVNATAVNANAVTFAPVSGAAGSGLPAAGVSALIADPSAPFRFYAGLSAADGAGAKAGVYRSVDGGAKWTPVNGSGTNVLRGIAGSARILLAIHTDPKNNDIYAAVIARSGILTGVFRSTDFGRSWTSLGVPVPAIFPGGQGGLHGALAADPISPTVVFIAGDRQDDPFPNASGCQDYVANTFRGDAALPPVRRWQSVVCDGANGTAPHADARSMIFDRNGDLLQANDGGIYRLIDPNQAARRRWVSVIGNMRPTEFHSIAYDPLSKVVFGGTQDNGNAVQSLPGTPLWNDLTKGDGGGVAVDSDQLVHPGTTLRYTNAFELRGFIRTTWTSANNATLLQRVRLNVASGACAGRMLLACDKKIQFYNPYVLNAITESRMLIGTNTLYESPNGGDRLVALTGDTGSAISGLAYGGRRVGLAYPGVIYAGDGTTILHRVNVGGAIVRLKYPGSVVRALVINPFDYRQIFVVDERNRVWLSTSEGSSWVEVTGNLGSLTGQVQSIGLYSPNAMLANAVLLAGGFGVFQLPGPGSGAKWTRLGTALPNALVFDLHYYSARDLLLAGSLGRGAWTLSGFFRGGKGAVVASRSELAGPPAPFGVRQSSTPPVAAAAR
jgi:hypothetical protein